jgi:hypothetical protein
MVEDIKNDIKKRLNYLNFVSIASYPALMNMVTQIIDEEFVAIEKRINELNHELSKKEKIIKDLDAEIKWWMKRQDASRREMGIS